MKHLLLSAALAFTATATAQTFGPWTVASLEGVTGNFAATFNDSGGVLGKYCFAESNTCYWLLVVSTTCEEGSEYPVLVNADQGAANLRIYCKPINGNNRYFFTDFDAIDRAVTGSSQIGIAFPLQNGKFNVSRFDVRSNASAMAALQIRMRDTPKARSNPRGTRDQTL